MADQSPNPMPEIQPEEPQLNGTAPPTQDIVMTDSTPQQPALSPAHAHPHAQPQPQPQPPPTLLHAQPSAPSPAPTPVAQPSASSRNSPHPTPQAPSQPIPHGSPTRVYLNQHVTPYLLEAMKHLATTEPEKPLKWLSEYLAHKSAEVEGS
ncbi:hypothetical protein ACN47E_002972 [Coniothyrium glycines]